MRPPPASLRALLTGIALLVAGTPTPALAWGPLGHRLIGRLAEERLSGDARRLVRRLLQGGSLGDNAVWADSVRATRRGTSPWHFINIPLAASPTEWRKYCPAEGCLLSALDAQMAVLADRLRPNRDRAEALRFVIHFIGDLHMPLHTSGRGDRGGNDVSVTWRGRSTNLHSVWDSPLLASANLDYDRWFGRLRAGTRRLDRHQVEQGGFVEWAAESHALARDFVYALPEPPELAGSYAAENLPRVEQRLIIAGIRLAAVLNRTLRR